MPVNDHKINEETHMTKLKLLSAATAALLTFALCGAPAIAQDEQPAEPDAATTDAPADPSSDAAPSDAAPAGEDAPAQQ
jgi:hypothetical protein